MKREKRTKYVIDRRFQLRTTLTVIGIIIAVAAIIITAIAVNATINNRRLENVVVIHTNIVDALLTYAQEIPGAGEKLAIADMSRIHQKNIETINTIIRHNYMLLVAIVSFIALQGVIVFVVLIRKTHRISGPIYVMSNQLRDLLEGKTPVMRPLRKGDEFQDFYALLKQVVERVKN